VTHALDSRTQTNAVEVLRALTAVSLARSNVQLMLMTTSF